MKKMIFDMRNIIVFFCLSLAVLLGILPTNGDALSYSLTIQPIQVCSDDGASCANPGLELFVAETQKIWDQASILIQWESWNIFYNSSFLDLGYYDDEYRDLYILPGAGQSSDPTTINMWFVQSIESDPGFYGVGCLDDLGGGVIVGCNGVAIADSVFSYNGGIGRLDTIAHELGHDLGLTHTGYGAGGANNLMTSGGSRNIPSSINDIFPDGLDLDQLTADQIAVAQGSQFVSAVVPEPATFLLLGSGLIGLGYFSRKRRG